MLAKRLRTLSIFAGGCLSGAVLIIVWQTDTETASPSKSARVSARAFEAPSDAEPAPAQDARRATARNVHEEAESGELSTPKHAPPSPKNSDEVAEAPTAESGRAVSDVLARLEAAYREQLGAAPASDAPASTAAQPPTTTAPQSLAAAPAAATLAPVSAPLGAPSRAEAPIAVAAMAAAPPAVPAVAPTMPVAVAAPAVAMPVAAAPLAAAPAVAPAAAASPLAGSPAAVPPTTQNLSVGSIHQGDTYHVQQVAITQYVPMFAPWPYPGYGYPQPQPTHTRSSQPRRVPYPTTLTNPDNPWGFNFPPSLEMVK
jgi:hypothetical protein